MSTDANSHAADPHVERQIRTPRANVNIVGTLEEVDRVYRICNKALLESGNYAIAPPSANPWEGYERTQAPSVDFLQARISHLEAQLRDSVHERIQELRRELGETRLERDMWLQAFTDLDNAVRVSLNTLQEPHSLTVREAIVIEQLSLL